MDEQRIRRAAGEITDDESLTGDLNDPEAMGLIEWGVAIARRLAWQTEPMDDTEAEAYFSATMPALRHSMRRIGKLVGALPHIAPEEIAARLGQIFESAAQVPVLEVIPPDSLESAASDIQASPPGTALTTILSYLVAKESDST